MAKTVLTVDDSASMRQLVKLTLGGAGYTVVEATDGADGLDRARSAAVDLVVTDLNMPRMDGISLIKELRKLPSYKGVPILLLTTESDDDRKKEARAAGATGWITKPFNQDQLLGVVRKVLGS
ncbi:response regulator [Telmatospirillum siberiense]|uniref:Two-component system response regulator n=1 Tax=Telmatospirillum siberiense TaxID=382514 RepID=A0A2N3PLV2_9PROT|nr:response regulator [Telmatospirillum siberiense]PKU21380.1 two-component system response regulator [Telmatospirillum siberiense]